MILYIDLLKLKIINGTISKKSDKVEKLENISNKIFDRTSREIWIIG